MDELELHRAGWMGVLVLGLVTFVALRFVVAPYGRHVRPGWGPTVPNRLAWILMETPAVLGFAWVYFQGQHAGRAVPLVMLGLWQLHYVHRTYVYPFRLRGRGKRMPAIVMLLGMAFQTLNAWLNARWISHLGSYSTDWLADPRFVLGALIFLGGMALNLAADEVLLRLRPAGESGYRVPGGPLYRHVSCPAYLGELIEWCGWALLTFSGAGLAFALYTAANLVPRALANHRWYRETFPDYPPERRAIIPGLL